MDAQEGFPDKAYDVEDYDRLMQLQSIPTVANVWASPTNGDADHAELTVRVLHSSCCCEVPSVRLARRTKVACRLS
jgi:hypothetical protein